MPEVTIRGVTYPTLYAAAKALGVSYASVKNMRKKGRLDMLGVGTGVPMPVRIRGVDYPSTKAAAKALGVSVNTVQSACARGTQDTVGVGRGHRQPDRINGGIPSKPVTLGGIEFPSMGAASRALGKDRKYVCDVLASRSPRRMANLERAVAEYKTRLMIELMDKQAAREREERRRRLGEK